MWQSPSMPLPVAGVRGEREGVAESACESGAFADAVDATRDAAEVAVSGAEKILLFRCSRVSAFLRGLLHACRQLDKVI